MKLSFFKQTNIAAITFSVLLLAPAARGALTITIDEIGADVVIASSGGSLLTSSTFVANTTIRPLSPSIGYLTFPGPGALYSNVTFTQTPSFGSGGLSNSPSSSSGPSYGIVPSISKIQVPTGYVSGSLLDPALMTFSGKSFADLGIQPGVYNYRYVTDAQSGSQVDTITLRIGQSSNVPDGGTSVALLSLSLLGVTGLRKILTR